MSGTRTQGTCRHGRCIRTGGYAGGLCKGHRDLAEREGRLPPRYVPSDRARAHLTELGRTLSTGEIAILVGLCPSTLHKIQKRSNLFRATEEKILAAKLDNREHFLSGNQVDVTATRRRLQGLAVAGHSIADLQRRLGMTKDAVTRLTKCDAKRFCSAITEQKVRKVTNELGLTPGTNTRVTARARLKGYAPLFAWDEDSIADPNALPNLTGYDPEVVQALLTPGVGSEGLEWADVDVQEAVRRSPEASTRGLATLMGVPVYAVAKHRDHVRMNRYPALDWAAVERMYVEENMSLSAISEALGEASRGLGGPSVKTLQRGMLRHGIKRRPPGRKTQAESIARRALIELERGGESLAS